ncbi:MULTISPECIES: hypothetical protein [unclassified Rhizobium]|uniref:hypothetical protein n=1 Tax=unclassified Rhizobium TaxID=2613769 RepID=UPI001FFE27D3|nr:MULTISPECIES: hypothetical protein [unclassified Rhizobium]
MGMGDNYQLDVTKRQSVPAENLADLALRSGYSGVDEDAPGLAANDVRIDHLQGQNGNADNLCFEHGGILVVACLAPTVDAAGSKISA